MDAVTLYVVELLDDLSIIFSLFDIADCNDDGVLRVTQSRAGHLLMRLDWSMGDIAGGAAFRGRSRLRRIGASSS